MPSEELSAAGFRSKSALFEIVLHEPEIPNNTGNIGRTCVATGCALHLIRPLGFDTSVKALRRAGLDYWPRLNVREHGSWAEYLRGCGLDDSRSGSSRPEIWLTSGKRGVAPWDVELRPGDHIVFGKETRGLPEEILEAWPRRVIMLPMIDGERGLNLATAVCAVVYEGIRQCVARGEIEMDGRGRIRLRKE